MRALARPLALVVAVAAATGCDRAIEVSLVPAASAVGVDVDLSCVGSVTVVAYPRDINQLDSFTCLEVPAGAVRALDDHDLAGTLDLAVPPSGAGHLAVYFHPDAGCIEPPVVIGGAAVTGSGDLAVPIAPVAGCNQRVTTPRTMRVIDFFALAERKACETPTVGEVGSGLMYANPYGPDFLPMEFALATLPEQPTAGIVTAPSSFRDAMLTGCPAAAAGVTDFNLKSAACVYPDAKGACAAATDQGVALELAYLSPADADANLDPAMVEQWLTAVVGIVVDANRNPIAGAQLQLRGDPAKVVYTARSGKRLTPIAASATDASGTFILYANQPARVTVKAGARSRLLRVGGWTSGEATGSATVIVL